jgi:hypothetical protein
MSKTFGRASFGKISNVNTVNGNNTRYYCTVELLENGRTETLSYVASKTDVADTGIWVYQQIESGNFEGEITDLLDNVNVFTGEPAPDQAPVDARRKRAQLLASTDWTQNADIPQATKDKWAPYRQALRDVPQQSGFPNNIVWPTAPQ